MILETTFVIDFLNGRKAATKKLEELQEQGEAILTTSLTVFEVTAGIKDGQEKEAAEGFFDSLEVLPLNRKTAKTGGEIQNRLTRKGFLIDPEDAMIAGIAILAKQPLLTKNTRHFSRVTSLKIKTY